ncbi:hypothetical protein JCM11641_005302 [Rhodosporidiobolus odoratus]
MLRLSTLALALAASASTSLAQSIPATASAEQLALVDAQYKNSGLNDGGNAGFGTDLKSAAILSVQYGFGVVENGQAYSVDQVSDAPDVYVTPASDTAAWFNSSTAYTLVLADASSLGDPDSRGNYRHFLVNGLTGAAASGSNLTFEPENGQAITNYAAPGPIEGTGPHRYAFLLFTQPEDFSAPANLSSPGVSPAPWYVSSYVQETGLQLVAASFFTVEQGTATGSVASTEAVNTATLTATSSGSSSSSSGPASSGAPSASATGDNSNSSPKNLVASVAAGVVGLGAALMMV